MIALLLAVTLYTSGHDKRDAYVLTVGESQTVALNVSSASMSRLRAMRTQYGSNFMWVRRGGRAYVIRDLTLLTRFDALFAPQRALEPEQREISNDERKLDQEIDALEDRDERLTDAEHRRLRDLQERQRAVEVREKELDDREEELEREAERELWRIVDQSIRSGVAVRE